MALEEKLKCRIKKLQALAERGVGGERETAKKKLENLLEKNGVTLEMLGKEKVSYYLFGYKGLHKRKLLQQCMYKVLGAKDDIKVYKSKGYRQKIGIYCTPAQKLEIDLEYEFYESVFDYELDAFVNAFIDKQNIYPEDAPRNFYDLNDMTEEELNAFIKQKALEEGITKRIRAKMIESKE